MDEVITKRDAIEAVNDVLAEYIPTFKPWQEGIPLKCALKIKAMPAVGPKHGKWIERESDTEDKENGFETVIVCSRCGYPATTFYSEDCESRTQIRTAFCPTCGADMRGGEE